MRRHLTIAIVFLLPVSVTIVAAAEIRTGGAAPPVALEALLQGPGLEAVTPEALGGQAVVLEFWSTWCLPCVEEIPHWNELVEEFAGKPVRFVAISDEDSETLGRFLERNPMKGWIGVDQGGATFSAYGIVARPMMILIDRTGVVRAATHPGLVTAKAIRQVLKGRTPRIPRSASFEEAVRDAVDAPKPPTP